MVYFTVFCIVHNHKTHMAWCLHPPFKEKGPGLKSARVALWQWRPTHLGGNPTTISPILDFFFFQNAKLQNLEKLVIKPDGLQAVAGVKIWVIHLLCQNMLQHSYHKNLLFSTCSLGYSFRVKCTAVNILHTIIKHSTPTKICF